MKSIEIDIYMKQFITFFDKNPDDLVKLIGNLDKEDFYSKVRERCEKNLKKDQEISLTQKQLIDIVVEMRKKEIPPQEWAKVFDTSKEIKKIQSIFQKTKFGEICLN